MRGRRFFPLDRQLRLRSDHWSEGAARVATRHGLRGPSFRQAAEEYSDAVGGVISESSLRRLTLDTGEKVVTWKVEEAERACAPGQQGEDPGSRRVVAKDPIGGQANVSTDGTMIRIGDEGWKEVKIGAISQVEVEPPKGSKTDLSQGTLWDAAEPRSSRRDEDPQVHLSSHNYCAGVWDADELGRHLYVEGLRRGIDQVERLSSVNDGARWIERIMLTNFPHARQIVDWNQPVDASGQWGMPSTLKAASKPSNG